MSQEPPKRGRRPRPRPRSVDPSSRYVAQQRNAGKSKSPSRQRKNRSVSPSRQRRKEYPSQKPPRPPNRGRSVDRARSRSRSVDRSRKEYPSQKPPRPPNRGRSVDRARSRSRSVDQSKSGSRSRKEYPSQEFPSQKSQSKNKKSGKGHHRDDDRSMTRGPEFTWRKLLEYAIPITILIGASVGLIFATGNASFLKGFIPTLTTSDMTDPYQDGTAPKWASDGNGLRVTIINALSDEWQTTFMLAVADWNFGDPDAVDITEERWDATSECQAPEGKVIVCNGDYGDVKWRGINEAVLDYRGEMVSTTARMNEFYLSVMDKGAWQYTMCHEMGHTLGLGHTDENFDNDDLGDCMDYTNNLNANKHPTKLNFDTLLKLYGPLSRRRMLRDTTTATRKDSFLSNLIKSSTTTTTETSTHTTSSTSSGEVSELRLRKKDSNNSNSNNKASARILPDHIQRKKMMVVKDLVERRRRVNSDDIHNDEQQGWRLVHRRLQGEEYEFDLGEGFSVRVQMFLAA